jgi:hypothetical protein
MVLLLLSHKHDDVGVLEGFGAVFDNLPAREQRLDMAHTLRNAVILVAR